MKNVVLILNVLLCSSIANAYPWECEITYSKDGDLHTHYGFGTNEAKALANGSCPLDDAGRTEYNCAVTGIEDTHQPGSDEATDAAKEICEGFATEDDIQRCRNAVTWEYFSLEAVGVCSRLGTVRNRYDCLMAIANKEYYPSAARACGQIGFNQGFDSLLGCWRVTKNGYYQDEAARLCLDSFGNLYDRYECLDFIKNHEYATSTLDVCASYEDNWYKFTCLQSHGEMQQPIFE
jgi:hypothetical protein